MLACVDMGMPNLNFSVGNPFPVRSGTELRGILGKGGSLHFGRKVRALLNAFGRSAVTLAGEL